MSRAVVEIHPKKQAVMEPGHLFTDLISVISLTLAFLGGVAGLPHVLMRFFTVPDGVQARRSAALATCLITYFLITVSIIGFGAIIYLVDNPDFSEGGTSLIGGSNMAAIYLSQVIGGDIFLGFISAVAFATILAVVAGLTPCCPIATVIDYFPNVLNRL